nr:T9SS type A sorting domain-containing protein [Bacteroidota bacterium]
LPGIAHLTWEAPDPPDDLLGYNVYRDSERVNQDTISNLYYDDNLSVYDEYAYYVTAIYPECESTSDTVSLVITSIPDIEKSGILVYPNPASQVATIMSETDIREITILNSYGRIIFSDECCGHVISISTGLFGKGLFIIRIHTSNGFFYSKFVIQ